MKVLYQSPPHPGGGAVWTVTQDPTMAGNPCLVRFTRRNSKRKLLEAKGLALAPAMPNRPGRELTYLTRVQKSGNLIVGKAYTAMQELQPCDEFEIEELEGGGFKLLPCPEAA